MSSFVLSKLDRGLENWTVAALRVSQCNQTVELNLSIAFIVLFIIINQHLTKQ